MIPARVRDARIDSLRAVAILAVVAGHAITVAYGKATAAPPALGVVFTLCAALGVPLFVFLAGWVARPDAGLAWVRGRAARLLVPYASWVVVQWLLWERDGGLARLLHLLANPRETNALWFLPALFLCSAAFAMLRRWDGLLIAAAVAAVFLVPAVDVFGLRGASAQFPYFVAGYYASRLRLDPRPAAVLAPAGVAAAWGGAGVGLQWATPAWAAGWTAAAAAAPALVTAAPLRLAHFAGPMGLVALAMVAVGLGVREEVPGQVPGAVADAWRWLGANTLGVYLGHIYFLRLHAGGGSAAVATSLLASLAGGVAVTLVLRRWQPAGAAFLGMPLRAPSESAAERIPAASAV